MSGECKRQHGREEQGLNVKINGRGKLNRCLERMKETKKMREVREPEVGWDENGFVLFIKLKQIFKQKLKWIGEAKPPTSEI